MPIKAGPKDVLRWVIALLLGAYALGAGAVLVIVAAGKLGLPLLAGLAIDLLILTTSWLSLVLWTVTVGGFALATVLLVRRKAGAFWAWLAGFASAALVQAMAVSAAADAAQPTDPSEFGALMLLAILGWGVFTLDRRRAPRLPRR